MEIKKDLLIKNNDEINVIKDKFKDKIYFKNDNCNDLIMWSFNYV
jgi:hypothetical protein